MLLSIQIRSERERGRTWHIINVAKNGDKEREDLSGRRMEQNGSVVRDNM